MEDTLFRKAFGDTPKIRVIEYLLELGELDCSLTDIAEGAEISRTTLFRIWPDFLKSKLVIHTRKIGNAKLYKINPKNPITKRLAEIFDEILTKSVEELATP